METLGSLFPITAFVAIALFIIRELLEFKRRRGADQRKRTALTQLLARECELNNWTVKSLRNIVSEIPRDENRDVTGTVTIERKPSGILYVRVISTDGGLERHYSIPKVHRELMSKFLLDIATLDKELFEVMEPAYDALANLEHLKESLVNAPDAPDNIGQDGYLEGFADYALVELSKAEAKLASLYRYCTNRELTKYRLR